MKVKGSFGERIRSVRNWSGYSGDGGKLGVRVSVKDDERASAVVKCLLHF